MRMLTVVVRLLPGLAILLGAAAAPAADANVPILVPVTGFLSLEGTSQRNGAVLALENPPEGVTVTYDVADTATSPEIAVNALERALADGDATAVAASMLGTQMLAMIPVANDYGVPLITVSGTAKITELDSPWVFRFFPGDAVTKVAHVDYAVSVLGARKPAIVYQTSAYGQSGRQHILANLERLGVTPVLDEGLDTRIKDMTPVLAKIRAAGADSLLLHLHAPPTALIVRAAATMKLGLPIIAGSAMHQPATAARLEPSELEGVCAESASSPVYGGSPALEAWRDAYRAAYDDEPDAFALGQYDGVMMTLEAIRQGARGPKAVADWLSANEYQGLAMRYRSDGTGNMAHSAVIMCYDGASRVPRIVKRYDNVTGVL